MCEYFGLFSVSFCDINVDLSVKVTTQEVVDVCDILNHDMIDARIVINCKLYTFN